MDPKVTTWSGLLAVWSDFARSAGALPKTGELGLLRRSVPAIIGLQALTQALAHIDCLASDEYRAGQDRAALIARTLRSELESIWGPGAIPDAISAIITDAHRTLEATHEAGYEYVVESDPFQMPIGANQLRDWRDRRGFQGAIFAAPAAKRVRAGLPVLFLGPSHGRPLAREELLDLGALLPGCLWSRVPRLRQVLETPSARGMIQTATTSRATPVAGREVMVPIEELEAAESPSREVHTVKVAANGALNSRGSL